jgi:hypothetical protein
MPGEGIDFTWNCFLDTVRRKRHQPNSPPPSSGAGPKRLTARCEREGTRRSTFYCQKINGSARSGTWILERQLKKPHNISQGRFLSGPDQTRLHLRPVSSVRVIVRVVPPWVIGVPVWIVRVSIAIRIIIIVSLRPQMGFFVLEDDIGVGPLTDF